MASTPKTDSGRLPDSSPAPSSAPASSERWLLGKALEPYQFLRVTGRGGTGTVYEAFHPTLQRRVAVKILRDDQLANAEAVARFEREIAVIGQLDHPNIVRAYDAGMADGIAYLIMEFVDGLNLQQILQRHNSLAVPDACEIVRQAAQALQYAFHRGIVHRDVKPSNILLTRAGQVKVSDLGLVRLLGPAGSDALTIDGRIVGTVDYLSPEQATKADRVDIRSDLYSLGCTLFHLLSGRAPFGDEDHDSVVKKLTAHVQEPPPSIDSLCPELPPEMVAVVNRLLQKRPEDRYAKPDELAEALSPFCDGSDVPGLLAGEPETPPSFNVVTGSPFRTPEISSLAETVLYSGQEQEAARGRARRRWIRRVTAAACALLISGGLAGGGYYYLKTIDTGADDPDRQALLPNDGDQNPLDKGGVSSEAGLILLLGEDDDYGEFALFGKQPAQIVWPGDHRGKPSWLYSRKHGRLEVTSTEVLLLRIGRRLFVPEQPAQPTVISVGLQQPVWHGQAGLFLGYREEDVNGQPAAVMQLFRLMTGRTLDGKEQWRLYRHRALVHPQSGTIEKLAGATAWAPIDPPPSSVAVRLELFINGGRLQYVRWDGKDLPSLVEEDANGKFGPEDYAGPWGLYNESTTTWFSNPNLHLRR